MNLDLSDLSFVPTHAIMRLLYASALELREFFGQAIPEYVILSHTWGAEEVTLQEIQTCQGTKKAGFQKVRDCCAKASEDGYDYVWIDTCW
jgi:hypothetical protein